MNNAALVLIRCWTNVHVGGGHGDILAFLLNNMALCLNTCLRVIALSFLNISISQRARGKQQQRTTISAY